MPAAARMYRGPRAPAVGKSGFHAALLTSSGRALGAITAAAIRTAVAVDRTRLRHGEEHRKGFLQTLGRELTVRQSPCSQRSELEARS